MRFIYVMKEEDKDKLIQLGYSLLKSDITNSVFVFENKSSNNINFSNHSDLDNIQYISSNVLTF